MNKKKSLYGPFIVGKDFTLNNSNISIKGSSFLKFHAKPDNIVFNTNYARIDKTNA